MICRDHLWVFQCSSVLCKAFLFFERCAEGLHAMAVLGVDFRMEGVDEGKSA